MLPPSSLSLAPTLEGEWTRVSVTGKMGLSQAQSEVAFGQLTR